MSREERDEIKAVRNYFDAKTSLTYYLLYIDFPRAARLVKGWRSQFDKPVPKLFAVLVGCYNNLTGGRSVRRRRFDWSAVPKLRDSRGG